MSNDHLEQLRTEILSLTEPERAELAHELIQSLDAPVGGIEGAWCQEISRRMAEIKTGQPIWLDRRNLQKRLQAGISIQQTNANANANIGTS